MNLVVLHGKVKKTYPSRQTRSGNDYSYFTIEVKKSYRIKNGDQRTQSTEILCCKFGEKLSVEVGDMVMLNGSISSRKEDDTYRTSVVINEISITDKEKIKDANEILPELPPLEDPPF